MGLTKLKLKKAVCACCNLTIVLPKHQDFQFTLHTGVSAGFENPCDRERHVMCSQNNFLLYSFDF